MSCDCSCHLFLVVSWQVHAIPVSVLNDRALEPAEAAACHDALPPTARPGHIQTVMRATNHDVPPLTVHL